MRLNEIVGGLTPAEKQALGVLERSGRWGLMYDARIEDGWSPSGQRSRTFQRQGRYQLVLMLDPGKPHPATGLFDEPKVEPEPIKFRPVPWTDEPAPAEPEPEPIELVERVEPVKADEPAPEPEPEPARVNVKKKKRSK